MRMVTVALVLAASGCAADGGGDDASEYPGPPSFVDSVPSSGTAISGGSTVRMIFSEPVHFTTSSHTPSGTCCHRMIGGFGPQCSYSVSGSSVTITVQPDSGDTVCAITLGTQGGLVDADGNPARASASFPIN